MDVGIALVAGVIIGWLAEWVIDWQYWRRGVRGFYEAETALRSQLADAEDELHYTNTALHDTRHELNALRAQLQAAKVREAELQRRLDASKVDRPESQPSRPTLAEGSSPSTSAHPAKPQNATGLPAPEVDQLTRIHGIGPAYAQRLYDAGVTSFSQVAEAAPEELERIIQPAAWQQIDFAGWSRQAGDLIAQPAVQENEGA